MPNHSITNPNTTMDGRTIMKIVSRVIGNGNMPSVPTRIKATNATPVLTPSNSITTPHDRDPDNVTADPRAKP